MRNYLLSIVCFLYLIAFSLSLAMLRLVHSV